MDEPGSRPADRSRTSPGLAETAATAFEIAIASGRRAAGTPPELELHVAGAAAAPAERGCWCERRRTPAAELAPAPRTVPARGAPRARAPVDAVRAPAVVGHRAGRAAARARPRGGRAAGATSRSALYTPSGAARARAFYEREGWELAPRAVRPEPLLGLDLVEYRRALL